MMKSGKFVVCASIALLCATVSAYVQIGADQQDNMPMVASEYEYNYVRNGAKVLTNVTVYRLELETDTQTPFIVGADGIRRQVVLMEPGEYAMLTGRVDKVWRQLNSTIDGRRMLHGREVSHEIDKDTHKKVDTYSDGFRHEQSIPPKRIRNRTPKANVIMTKPSGMSDRQWELRKAVMAVQSATPKAVTVEHDATTGKDTVK